MTIRTSIFLVTALTCVSVTPLFGQYPVDARNRGERIIVVVPMTGASGSKRPAFAPSPDEMRASGILEFRYQVSDDGNSAIVEFVARDKAALKRIATDSRVLQAFEKGKDKKEDIERELKRYRKDFALGPLVAPIAPQAGSAQ